jgi:hypothetical protein
MQVSGGLWIEYSFVVCKHQVDYPPNIHSMCAGVRRMSDRIFIQCMQGSGRLPTEY